MTNFVVMAKSFNAYNINETILKGAMTLSITIFSIKTLSIMTFSIITFSIMTFSTMHSA